MGSPRSIGFALLFLMLVGILPAAGDRALIAVAHAAPSDFTAGFDSRLDENGNGLEDLLDAWLDGRVGFDDLRAAAVSAPLRAAAAADGMSGESAFPAGMEPAGGSWQAGNLRLICLGAGRQGVVRAMEGASRVGDCRLLHSVDRFGGVAVLAGNETGLRAFLADRPGGRIMIDRDGVPALADSRHLAGAARLETGRWQLGDDWSSSVAILDSGCDTAHGDLGDYPDDDKDGPPPVVGDASDWFPADNGWPLFEGYKVVGWQDVTDDFPLAAGPWDYHYHGTALASVVVGSGRVDPAYRGLASGSRLTVVKFYDFDQTWHAWAGDFLAACAWTLDHRDIYRIRTVLTAVNWDVDAGISTAMNAFVAAGMLPVAAAGNDGVDHPGLGFPASLPEVVTVGSVNGSGAVSAFSSRGLAVPGKPDLLAPGGGLLGGGGRIIAADNEPNDTYSGRFGTSLAAAHVAGALQLLDEALLENGIILPADGHSALTRAGLLKLTAAPVVLAENDAGTGQVPLSFPVGPDAVRGWGTLRVDAAAEAALLPLMPGRDQLDTLTSDWEKPVVARRLITSPQIRYLIEAVPSGSLDVVLEVADPRWLDDPATVDQVRHRDANGPGVSEFTYLRPDPGNWLVMVVKRKSGQGTVSLKIREADSFPAQAAAASLPGLATGAPNSGNLAGLSGPTLIIPSRVTVDLGARSLSALDTNGDFRPGWPVFVFPHSSSQGGLTQPLVWDMDGVPGDEIVVASDFGSIYFFAGSGAIQEVALTLNRNLTTPVGIVTSGGNRRVAAVDKLGMVRSWSHGPVLEAQADLGHSLPLTPAAGVLVAGAGESLVIAFADGHVTALDENLNALPGWPRDLGVALEVAPVLCDLDDDGFHEIILPALDPVTGRLAMRVLDATGQPGTGDDLTVPAPEGGSWLALSAAVVAGGYQTGDLRVTLTGLADNGLFGDQDEWVLGHGSLAATGVTTSSVLPGFRVKASTSQGLLTLDHILLPAPLAWNFQGSSGTDVNSLVSVDWSEILIGVTSLPGACTTWLSPSSLDRPLVRREPLTAGGKTDPMYGSAGAMLIPVEDDVYLRVDILSHEVGIQPVRSLKSSQTAWTAARGDGRNSGACPLREAVSPVPVGAGGTRQLVAFPNPGGGNFQFRLTGVSPSPALKLEIFDLRGRRVRVLGSGIATDSLKWDGNDSRGRPLAAGTYLAVVRGAGRPLVSRVVLTR
ncbi:MAG: S8 family serine peptidase [Candidatus Krumholzibacteriota bacterium]